MGKQHLLEEDVMTLSAHSRFHGASTPEYGTPLETVTCEHENAGEWLEAAIMAGHLPSPRGLALALRGWKEVTAREADERLVEDPRAGVRLGSDAAMTFRKLSGMVERFTSELEAMVANRLRQPPSDIDTYSRGAWAEGVLAAEARGRRAESRARMSDEDNRNAWNWRAREVVSRRMGEPLG